MKDDAKMMSSLAELAAALRSEVPAGDVELTCFPSGGAMLDVRRRDQRAFVLAYSPAHGYGVDELHADDGFVSAYRFVYSDFDSAARKLRELAANGDLELPSQQAAALNLVVIQVKDLEASKEFYDCLGFELHREQHGGGPQHYAAELGSTVFEVYPCLGNARPGNVRIGFRVPFLEPVLSALRQRSISIVSEPRDSPWGRRAVVQDPDGNHVELTEGA